MNQVLQMKWAWIDGAHSLRAQLLDSLSDADLAFTPGGQNMRLGTLLRALGEVEYSYTQSLKTGQQDWSYRNREAGSANEVARLKAWFTTLDDEMLATIEALSDDDLAKTIDRGGGSSMPLEMQLDVYLQAQLIFLGKLSIYFRAMSRELSKAFMEYIG